MTTLLRYACMLFCLACLPILTNAQCTVNAGTDYSRCIYSSDSIVLHGTVVGNFTTYSWTSSGSGVFDKSTTLNPEYFHNAADITNSTITFTLTASGGTCGSVTDQVTITVYKLPKVTLPGNFSVCGSQVALNSTVTGTSTLNWTAAGSGTFSTTTSANTVYTASSADISRGNIIIMLNATAPASSCIGSDTVLVTLLPVVPTNAGNDLTVCTNNSVTMSNATASGPILWTTSGTGTIISPTSLSAVYLPSAADNATGSVTLTLTGTSPTCGTSSDALVVTILPNPIVSAGVSQNICGNTATLSGTVTPSSGTIIQWSNVIGSGTFSNASSLTSVYVASNADLTRQYALLRMQATSIQGCVEEDTMVINLSSAPVVFAGSNQLSCSGSVTVHGYAIKASSKTWTTSGSGTFANASRDTTSYTPSSADRTSGMVTLTYTGVNSCGTASSTAQVNFIGATPAQVSAGADQTVCGYDTIVLSGSVANATGGKWTTNGSGHFVYSSSHLANVYKLSAADKTAGSVTFTLTSYSSGGCSSASDTKTVTILAGLLPHVNAGPDQVSAVTTQLNATVSNAASQLWQTSGSGVFTPNPTSVNSSYIPSAADIAAESVVLTLVASGTCASQSDALTLFTATPSSVSGTVKAGANTLDHGIVYLFSVDNTEGRKLVGVDTISQSSNGSYAFSSVPTGQYTVYAVPFASSGYAATHLATYLGSSTSIEWENAGHEEVTNGSSAHVLNVNLVAYTSAVPNWNTGTDTISGAIFINTPTPLMRLAGPEDKPLSGAVVYLKTVNGQVITYTLTDKNGMYAFNNVLRGNYFIDTEYSYTEEFSNDKIVAVDGNPLTVEDGSVIVNTTTLTTGVITSNKSVQIHAYPNPTTDHVQLQLPKSGNYSVKVLDETGLVHMEQQLSATSGVASAISLSGLNKGMYIMQITSGEEVYTTKVIKF